MKNSVHAHFFIMLCLCLQCPASAQEIQKQAAADVAKEVEKINQKVKGWAYGISKQKFEAMVKKPEDLLKPVETT